MFCKNCGKENKPGVKFCFNCGTKMNSSTEEVNENSIKEAAITKDAMSKNPIKEVPKDETNSDNKEVIETTNTEKKTNTTAEVEKSEETTDDVKEIISKDKVVSESPKSDPVISVSSTEIKTPEVKVKTIKEKKKRKTYKDFSTGRKILNLILAVLLILGAFGGYSYYKRNNVSKGRIKSELLSKSYSVGSIKGTLEESNMKNITIENKKRYTELGISCLDYEGTIEVATKDYTLTLPFISTYIYKNGWTLFGNQIQTSNATITMASALTEDIIRSSLIDEKLSDIVFTKDIVKDLNVTIGESFNNGTAYKFTAEGNIDGSLLSTNVSINGNMVFNGSTWSVKNLRKDKLKTNVKPLTTEVSSENVIKELKTIISEDKTIYTSIGNNDSIYMKLAHIKNISDVTTNTSANTISGNFKANVNLLSIEGNIIINLDNSTVKINTTSSVMDNPTVDIIKATLLSKSISYKNSSSNYKTHYLTEDNLNSLQIDEIITNSDSPITFYIWAKMNFLEYTGDDFFIEIDYDPIDNEWSASKIRSSTEYSDFSSYFNKDDYRD